MRTSADTDLMRRIAQEAIERFGDDAQIVYQAHRQLLFAMDVDGASQLLPRIQNSTMPTESILYAEMRQLCAENRVDDARRALEQLRNLDSWDRIKEWIPLKILGDDDEAEMLLAEFDAAGDIPALRSYLNYPAFDATPFPNLMAAYAGQGLEKREVMPIPYRCNR